MAHGCVKGRVIFSVWWFWLLLPLVYLSVQLVLVQALSGLRKQRWLVLTVFSVQDSGSLGSRLWWHHLNVRMHANCFMTHNVIAVMLWHFLSSSDRKWKNPHTRVKFESLNNHLLTVPHDSAKQCITVTCIIIMADISCSPGGVKLNGNSRGPVIRNSLYSMVSGWLWCNGWVGVPCYHPACLFPVCQRKYGWLSTRPMQVRRTLTDTHWQI